MLSCCIAPSPPPLGHLHGMHDGAVIPAPEHRYAGIACPGQLALAAHAKNKL